MEELYFLSKICTPFRSGLSFWNGGSIISGQQNIFLSSKLDIYIRQKQNHYGTQLIM